METVKKLIGDEFQSLKHEIQVHFGPDSAQSSGNPQKPQVAESHEHPSGDPHKPQVAESDEHKLEPSSITKNHIEYHHEDAIQVDSELQHADLSSVSAKEVQVKENSKSVSQSTNTATAEETHTVKETDTTHDESNEEGQVQLQPQVQVQERAFQILARGSKSPVVSSGSPGQYN